MLTPRTIVTIALLLVVCFHGAALFYTLSGTYDAYVHIFFADHYVRSWFEPWEYRWYTGFTITSYPPLSHQLIALLSMAVGLKVAFSLVILTAVCGLVVGTYRFARLLVADCRFLKKCAISVEILSIIFQCSRRMLPALAKIDLVIANQLIGAGGGGAGIHKDLIHVLGL